MNDASTIGTTDQDQTTQLTDKERQKAYESVMEAIKAGALVTMEDLKTARQYAKETGAKRPTRAILVPGQNRNKGKECSRRGCHKPATALTMCQMHYAREYRKDPEKRKKANEASRRWAEKHKGEPEGDTAA